MAQDGTGAALRMLSADQVRSLVLLAREAYLMVFPPTDLDFDAWRHQQCMLAVERRGLTACRNEDYLPLKAHFLGLLGRPKEAQAARTRAEVEPRSWALRKLHEEALLAREAADRARIVFDPLAYVDGFLRHKRKVGLDEADAKTIWHAVFVLRRRATQFRRKVEATAAA